MTKIILLMGIGSTGKTTLANQLVQVLDEVYLIDGFDHAVEKNLDKKYWPDGALKHEGFQFIDGPTGPQMQVGPKGAEFLEFMISDIIKKAKAGNNIIIDYVPSDEDIARFKKELPDVEFISIGLKPPVEWAIKKELERGDRQVGVAKQIYEHFYDSKVFDIEFDTSSLSPQVIANRIKDFLRATPRPSLK
jgi:chloramphenicol 3-O phosphotransferase